MSKIKESCINGIKNRAEILPVVESFITLKKGNAGGWMACCPFHSEKTPSFHVTPKKNIFKCFGCGEGGDPLAFVMAKMKVEFMDAIKWMATFYNIELEYEDGSKSGGRPKAEYSQQDALPEEAEGAKIIEEFDMVTEWTMAHLEVMFAKNILAEAKMNFEKSKEKKEASIANMYEPLIRVLQRYHCYPMRSFAVIKNRKKHIYTATAQFPMFMFDHGTWKKIYKPLEEKKEHRFMYMGEKPADVLNGYLEALKELDKLKAEEEKRLIATGKDDNEAASEAEKLKHDHIILCSGERDSMNVAAMGYYPVWMNSETAKLHGKLYAKLKGIGKNIYNLPDIDDTGIREAHALALEYLDLYTIWLPNELRDRKDNRYGKPCKDIRDYLRFFKRKDFDNLVADALPYQFWEERAKYDKKGNYVGMEYVVDNLPMYNFLRHNGFGRFAMESKGDDGAYVYRYGNVVKEVTAGQVKLYIHKFLQEIHAHKNLRNAFFRTTQLSSTSLTNIPFTEYDFNDRVKDGQYFFFKNTVWHITKNDIKEYAQGDVKKYVWQEDVIDNEVTKEPDHFTIKEGADHEYDIDILDDKCMFLRFLIQSSRVHWQKELEVELQKKTPEEIEEYTKKYQFNITSPLLTEEENHEQKLHLINKIYAIGYLMHRYVDSRRPWCVFAMDYRIGDDDKSYGGSGKSIVFNVALRKLLKKCFYMGGRKKDLTADKHIYDGLTEHHRYMLIDDANEFLDFDFFFTNLTGEINVNPKNQKPYTIPFELKGKMAITSNFMLRKVDPSTERRLLYTVFSDYYHDNKDGNYKTKWDPYDEFGKELFKEFTDDEYNHFYNTMAQCLKWYLNFDKIEPPLDQVNKRNLLTEMGASFKAWADIYFSEESGNLNNMVVREWAYEDFCKNFNYKGSAQRFLNSIRAWSTLNKFELNPKEMRNKDGRIIRNRKFEDKNGEKTKTFEMIFISTKKLEPEEIQKLMHDTSVIKKGTDTATQLSLTEKDDMPF